MTEYEELCMEHERKSDELKRVYDEYKAAPSVSLLERCRMIAYTISDIEWDMERCKPDFKEVKRPQYAQVYSNYSN